MTAPWRPSGYADGADGDALKAKRAACAARGHRVLYTFDDRVPRCEDCGADMGGPSVYDNNLIRVEAFEAHINRAIGIAARIQAGLLDARRDTMIPPAMMGAAVHSHAEASHGNTIGQRGTESRTEGGAGEERAPGIGQPVADDRNEGLERVDGAARGSGGG